MTQSALAQDLMAPPRLTHLSFSFLDIRVPADLDFGGCEEHQQRKVVPLLDGRPLLTEKASLVFDATDLLDSQGASFATDLVTCSCGEADCAGLFCSTLVLFGEDVVIWSFSNAQAPARPLANLGRSRELTPADVQGIRGVGQEEIAHLLQTDAKRWEVVFNKAQYLGAVAALREELQSWSLRCWVADGAWRVVPFGSSRAGTGCRSFEDYLAELSRLRLRLEAPR